MNSGLAAGCWLLGLDIITPLISIQTRQSSPSVCTTTHYRWTEQEIPLLSLPRPGGIPVPVPDFLCPWDLVDLVRRICAQQQELMPVPMPMPGARNEKQQKRKEVRV